MKIVWISNQPMYNPSSKTPPPPFHGARYIFYNKWIQITIQHYYTLFFDHCIRHIIHLLVVFTVSANNQTWYADLFVISSLFYQFWKQHTFCAENISLQSTPFAICGLELLPIQIVICLFAYCTAVPRTDTMYPPPCSFVSI